MKILSIGNHKGGVGKTATARALGDALSRRGARVLLVDMDPQASLTTSCGLSDVSPNLADVLGGAQPGRVPLVKVIRNIAEGLDLAPSNLSMAGAELGLQSRMAGRDTVLARALGTVTGYDIAIIDNPPSLGQLVINSLAASDAVLIPCQPLPVDVAGLRLFLQTIDWLRETNARLSVLGIVPTFYDDRLNAHRAAVEAMRAEGWPVLPVRIGRSVRVGESALFGESVITFEPGNPQAVAYEKLGELVLTWLKRK